MNKDCICIIRFNPQCPAQHCPECHSPVGEPHMFTCARFGQDDMK